jgi:hypothetical protein
MTKEREAFRRMMDKEKMPYVVVSLMAWQNDFGGVNYHTQVEQSKGEISEVFKDSLYNDLDIDLDKLRKEAKD